MGALAKRSGSGASHGPGLAGTVFSTSNLDDTAFWWSAASRCGPGLETVDEGFQDRAGLPLSRKDRPGDQVDQDTQPVEDGKYAEPESDQVDVDPKIRGKPGAHPGGHPAVPGAQQPFAPAAVVLAHINDHAQTRYALSSGISPPLP